MQLNPEFSPAPARHVRRLQAWALAAVAALLAAGASVHGASGGAALRAAARGNDPGVVATLLAAGAPVDGGEDSAINTPLMVAAAEAGSQARKLRACAVAQVLIDAGADVLAWRGDPSIGRRRQALDLAPRFPPAMRGLLREAMHRRLLAVFRAVRGLPEPSCQAIVKQVIGQGNSGNEW